MKASDHRDRRAWFQRRRLDTITPGRSGSCEPEDRANSIQQATMRIRIPLKAMSFRSLLRDPLARGRDQNKPDLPRRNVYKDGVVWNWRPFDLQVDRLRR